jgi:hypothetical protein
MLGRGADDTILREDDCLEKTGPGRKAGLGACEIAGDCEVEDCLEKTGPGRKAGLGACEVAGDCEVEGIGFGGEVDGGSAEVRVREVEDEDWVERMEGKRRNMLRTRLLIDCGGGGGGGGIAGGVGIRATIGAVSG